MLEGPSLFSLEADTDVYTLWSTTGSLPLRSVPPKQTRQQAQQLIVSTGGGVFCCNGKPSRPFASSRYFREGCLREDSPFKQSLPVAGLEDHDGSLQGASLWRGVQAKIAVPFSNPIPVRLAKGQFVARLWHEP
ncbi:uncharacterized protein TrAtP1_003567 [Trichoderma atroviride]|uniref:uncharacterized protein n=1 Tax=Hypocrea atroviridis TaxID=63577 RepID=UPI003323A20A|nr:hypothetical protein TrAtP1_003567 [Trichoderma atroviride]